ncbi:MAG: VCBS repeat-containing protein, partial [Phycisphaerales bacterium]|nr:VCBS repeat-containing protein [Phycisphaerales bacterium]
MSRCIEGGGARAILLGLSGLVIGLSAASPARAIVPFTQEATARGLNYVMQNYPVTSGIYGFGITFADLDGDGDQDVVLAGAADGRVGVYENDGTGHFTSHSLTSGIPLLPQASGVSAADYDGDGDTDLYLMQIGLANVLMRNDGGFTFTDVTIEAGV